MTRDLIRRAETQGWRITRTRGGHLRLTHPLARMPVFAASTPSDHRALRNALANLRRALRSPERTTTP